jgi:DNA replication protein DnaC
MKTADPVDTARVELFLADLRLPAIKQVWAMLAEQSDKEGWPAARFLAALAEHEIADRGRRRIERHLAEAKLPVGKTLDSFDFDAVPMVSKAQVVALTAGDSWLEKGANLLLFGPPGGGKSHLAAAIGLALVENGWRVLFTRTSDLVQRLQIARRELALEGAIAKLDKYHLLILDDIAYVSKDQAETSVLFELIGSRYERRSMLITSNQSFGDWGKVFPDQAMTLAAIDRLVHHATILEMNVESYRRRAALDRKRGSGRPPAHATIKNDNQKKRLRRTRLRRIMTSLSAATSSPDCCRRSHPDCRATGGSPREALLPRHGEKGDEIVQMAALLHSWLLLISASQL